MSEAISTSPHVGLFVTCLVDLTRPSVGFATLKLLELAGCRVSVPEMQTCCGQPAYNSGDRSDTRGIAKQVIETFQGSGASYLTVDLIRVELRKALCLNQGRIEPYLCPIIQSKFFSERFFASRASKGGDQAAVIAPNYANRSLI